MSTFILDILTFSKNKKFRFKKISWNKELLYWINKQKMKGWEKALKSFYDFNLYWTNEYVSISTFVSLFGIPVGIASSEVDSKIYARTSGIKCVSQ